MMENIKLPKFSSVVKVGMVAVRLDQKARLQVGTVQNSKIGAATIRTAPLHNHCSALPATFPRTARMGELRSSLSDLLGALGGKPSVWALLLFADPVADIAVLGLLTPRKCLWQVQDFPHARWTRSG